MSSPTNIWHEEDYAKHARFVSDLGTPVIELLHPMPGERILDVGCGDGALTAKVRDLGAAVVGIDPAEDFIRAAQEKGIDARLMPVEAMPFEQEFDAAYSNAVLHWIKNPVPAAERIYASLKPGGRFAAEMGGHGNMAAVRTAIHAALESIGCSPLEIDPWYFPTPAEYSKVLDEVGFNVESAVLIPRPTILPTDMKGWLHTFAASWMAPHCGSEMERLIDEIDRRLRPILMDQSGVWTADYMRLRILAVRPF